MALPIAALAKPPGGGAKSLSLTAAPNPVVFGGNVALQGKLGGPSHDGKTVRLEADAFPYEGNFANVGSAVTNAGGNWTLSQKPAVNTRYRARQGNTLSPVATELVRIKVSRRVSDSTPAAGRRVRFKGRACPQHDGAQVRIQRRTSSGKWRTRRRTTLRDIPGSTCSRYSKRFRVYSDGTYRIVVATPHADHANGISRSKRINVH
jgi:hypothetical protein